MKGLSTAKLRRIAFASGLLAPAIMLASAAHAQATTSIDTSTQKESGFTGGVWAPFLAETGVTVMPNSIMPFTKDGEPAIKTYWTETSYNGTRATKGAEARPSNFDLYSDGWFAFQFMLPSGFPSNKESGIAQLFQKGCNSWMVIFRVVNNQLFARRRLSNDCGAYTDHLISDNIVRDAWKSTIIRWKVSQSHQGELKIWYANEPTPRVDVTGINIGGGTFSGDTLDPSVPLNGIASRFGQYAFDNANYTPGEQRIVYYDDVSVLKGNPSNAYSLVKPF